MRRSTFAACTAVAGGLVGSDAESSAPLRRVQRIRKIRLAHPKRVREVCRRDRVPHRVESICRWPFISSELEERY